MLDLQVFSHTLCDGSNMAARSGCENKGVHERRLNVIYKGRKTGFQ